MDYFDGTEEELKGSGSNKFGRTYYIRSYEPGSSPGRFALGPLKITILIMVIGTLFFLGLSLLIGLLSGSTFVLIVLVFTFMLIMGFFAFLVILIVFLSTYIMGGKVLENNKTTLTGEGIEFRYQKDSNVPEQLTLVPFRYLVNIHPVRDEEWTGELGMGGFLRRLLGSPRDIPNLRFPRGSGRNNVYVLQMSSEMPVRSLKKKTGAIGKMALFTTPLTGALMGMYDQYVDENLGRSSKIFFSIKNEKYNEFVQLLDQARKREEERIYGN